MCTQLFQQIWESQDAAYELMSEYDSLPHCYGSEVLYQAEAYIVNLVGRHPGITVTQLAEILNRTTSACSQIVRKLKAKGFVEQIRNPSNNRLYNLELTEAGAQVFQAHAAFNRECQQKTFELLKDFTDEELLIHLRVQNKLNQAYQDDVRRSREQFAKT